MNLIKAPLTNQLLMIDLVGFNKIAQGMNDSQSDTMEESMNTNSQPLFQIIQPWLVCLTLPLFYVRVLSDGHV